MKSRPIARIALVAACAALMSPFASAGQETTDVLKGQVRQLYQHISGGEWQDAMGLFADGSRGFLDHGMVMHIPNESVKQMIAQNASASHAEGNVARLYPKHIMVTMLGEDHALATYYVDGKKIKNGHESAVMNRLSLVFAKKENGWKIVHWHASPLDRETEEG